MFSTDIKETSATFGLIVATMLVAYLILRIVAYLVKTFLTIDTPALKILDTESYPHALMGSAAFVADYIVASFNEGMVIRKHGTLGKALLHHWRHACKYHPEKVKCLDSESRHFLQNDPAVFYASVGCKEHFIQILNALK